MPTTGEVKALYRAFLRAGARFPNYNVREFVKRRAGERFREMQQSTNSEAIMAAWNKGQAELEVVRRQSIIYSLYAPKEKSVMDMPLESLELATVPQDA